MDIKTVGKIIERFGIYIAVGLFAFFAFNGWKNMEHRADLLEQRNIRFEEKMQEWTEKIGEIAAQQGKIVKEVEEKKVQEKQIRMNVGKEIKEFNKTVKEIKKIEDPQESIDAMRRAWNSG